MATDRIRIATRNSPLALWQANHVRRALEARYPDLEVVLAPMTTTGDRMLGTSLAAAGGKALFVKELERALLEQRADIAVHSMKDVPMEFPDGLGLAVICERGDAADALVSNDYDSLDELPRNATIGTSSLRRQCQLHHLRPDLQISDLRGNVGTRLGQLDGGMYHGIVLAAAGLQRLDLAHRIRLRLGAEQMLAAAGQGAIGIECRTEDLDILRLISVLHHHASAVRVAAERSVNGRLGGGCRLPIASFAEHDGDELRLRALVGTVDGSRIVRAESRGDPRHPERLGMAVAEELIAEGAAEILQTVTDFHAPQQSP